MPIKRSLLSIRSLSMSNETKQSVSNQIDCHVHGEAIDTVSIFSRLENVGVYCMLCLNDFISKNIKNYLKESTNEDQKRN